MLLDPGIHKEIPFSVYNDHPAIRSSLLKLLLKKQPVEFKHAMDSVESKSSDALLKGEVLHAMLLEPVTVDHRFIFEKEPLRDKNKLERNGGSKEKWDALKAFAEATGKPIVSHDIYSDCLGMTESVRKNPLWDKVERFGLKELTLIADINGVRCKVRFDALLKPISLPGLVIDIKTTSKGLSDREIQGTICDHEYQLSAGMYVSVAEALGLPVDKFRWLFMQSEPPYQYRFIDATPEMLERGKMEFLKTLEIYRMAAENDNWSGYFGQSIDSIGLPDWYSKRVYPWGTFQ